jgi:hypothetical protein
MTRDMINRHRVGEKRECVYWGESGLEETLFGGEARSSVPRGGFLRARLRESRVTPLPSFVIPTTGGSSLLTNSQRPMRQNEHQTISYSFQY